MSKTIKIYGYGVVGKAMSALFPFALIHDPFLGHINEATTDVAFICVPTNLKDGKLDCSIVEDLIAKGKEDLFIIRSAVNPGFCDEMEEKYGKNLVNQPEYLGEGVAPTFLDERKTPFMVLGGRPGPRRKAIEIYQQVYNANIKIRQVTNLEAEVIKLSENRAIAFKMMSVQELYDCCEAAGVDFYTVREAVYGDDPRFTLPWTFVYPDKRGFNNSKCLVKDVPAWDTWAESVGVDSVLTKAIIKKSNEYEAQRNNP